MNSSDATIGDELGLWWKEVPSFPGHKVGCLGAINDSALLPHAEDRLREAGCTLAIGPMEGNTWRSHRAVIESTGRAPFLLEPTARPIFQEAGYDILARYSSSLVNLLDRKNDFDRLRARLNTSGIIIRPLQLEALESELKKIYALSLRAFTDNFLYTPISETEFLGMYLKIAPLLTTKCAFLAECERELVGFVFGYPDRESMVVKTLAVLPERRFAGLGTVLVEEMQEAARAQGFREAIHALQREDNQSLRISERFGATVFRRYALFSKVL